MLNANLHIGGPLLPINTPSTITLHANHKNFMLSFLTWSSLLRLYVQQQSEGDKINRVQNKSWTCYDFEDNSNIKFHFETCK
jgi:hypothetical protein